MNLTFQALSKSYRDKLIFSEISGKLGEGERIGLVGSNGVGKTTLAKILSGKEIPDQGQINFNSSGKIAFVEQLEDFSTESTVYNEVFQAAGGRKEEVSLAFAKMGLGEELWQRMAHTLSGGEKTKLSLCKVMVQNFDLLILDEPTNHLDLQSLGVFEEYLMSLDKPTVVISHDRFFLERIATTIWELTMGRLRVYPGNYTAYKMQKEIELKYQRREYYKQEQEIEHLKQEISQRSNWFRGAHRAAGQNDFYRAKAKKHASRTKAKKRELARLEENKLEKLKCEVAPAFELINKQPAERLPKHLIGVRDLTKSYGERVVFQDLTLDLLRGDRIAIIGPNGAGKSTLLKAIAGIEEADGTISTSPQVKLGYLPQELDHLHPEHTILEEVVAGDLARARQLLASLMFRGELVEKKISALSMGEKARVAFAKLILSDANVLLLDEPTNYLDIISREKIEDVLDQFQGSIIFVSHDRYSIRRLATKIAVAKERSFKLYRGGYDYYLEKSQEKETAAVDFGQLKAEISRLECHLAFLGGRLSTCQEDEKEQLDQEFKSAARKLRACKDQLERG
jgi:ATPase subunit of ABC transporter with duplicated ATPase domains